MREVILDTETTGLDPKQNRVVEIGCIELVNSIATGREYHTYIRPDDDYMPAEAFAVHGISQEFLSDKPRFGEIVKDFLAFLEHGRIVAHNAEFDMGFLNAELLRVGYPPLAFEVLDTMRVARRKYPGSSVSLDALCERFGVDASGREKHGALLDAYLLAEVYVELLGTRQPGLDISVSREVATGPVRIRAYREPRGHAASTTELANHKKFLAELTEPIWNR